MELTNVLVLFAAGWTISLALPVQVLNITTYEDYTSFGKILTKNKGIIDQLLEGDIAPRPAPSRGAMVCSNCFWPKSQTGTVLLPYTIASIYTEKEKSIIKAALGLFELLTCVKFVEKTTENDYISIESATGCWSVLGKVGGKQTASLNQDGCVTSETVQHEMIHALGFYHEQSRSDRDKYVNILSQNICPGKIGNFELKITNNWDLPYDYSSIMHYPRDAFTINGKDTIVPKPDPKVEIGVTTWMSNLDIKKINVQYKCNLCRTKFTVVTSGSFSSDDITFGNDKTCVWIFQTPYLSSQKIYLEVGKVNIPQSSGCRDSYLKIYDGETRESNVLQDKACGSTIIPLIISSEKNLLMELVSNQESSKIKFNAHYKTVPHGHTFLEDNGSVISPSFPFLYRNNVDSFHSIIAPSSKKVSLEFTVFHIEYCKFTCSCVCDYVKIYDGPVLNSPLLGRFCGFAAPALMVSTQNVVIVHFHSDGLNGARGFLLQYSFVG
ncbi:astacin-like metalloendopeptidase isoform X2 [Pelobates fuscus]|uniref:astacin-like metalloendopeptidase isoform X2 n=1 Tax=Pelobates fuscus TaxID=191477 RepID=UPI002FE4CFCE